MAAGNADYNDLFATTLAKHRDKMVDNVFTGRVLLWLLTEKNKVDKLGGGRSIVTPLMYGEGQASSYGEWDTITITPQSGITAAEFQWKQVAATIAISGLEEAQNDGEAAVIKLLKSKVKQAEMTMRARLNTQFYSDGTGNSGKDVGGLALLVDDGGTNVGGIDATDVDNAWWRSVVTDYAALATPTQFRAIATNHINSTKELADGSATNAILTTQAIHEAYESQLYSKAQFSDQKSLDAGYHNILVHGVPVYWESEVPTGEVYGLNTEFLGVVGHKDRWFKQSPFTDGLSAANGGVGTTVDARYSIITSYLNMECSNRAKQWKMTGLDPADLTPTA